MFLLSRPGKYVFRYELVIDSRTRVSSEPLEIDVASPAAEDQDLLRYIGNPDRLAAIYPPGAPRGSSKETLAEFLAGMTARFPSSSYTPYALLRLAYVLDDPKYNVKETDYGRSLEAANGVVTRFPRSAVAGEAAYVVASMLRKLRMTDELNARMSELKAMASLGGVIPAECFEKLGIANEPQCDGQVE